MFYSIPFHPNSLHFTSLDVQVLTTRIAYLLQHDVVGKVLAVTFTRKAAGEMHDRLETLLREQEQHRLVEQETKHTTTNENNHNHEEDEATTTATTLRMDRFGQLLENTTTTSSMDSSVEEEVDEAGAIDPRGLERVEMGTFHSICAKILRYNGEALRQLPSVARDMSQAVPVVIEQQQQEEDNNNAAPHYRTPEINLNGQFNIVDQAEQIRIVKDCLLQQEIDLKKLDIKPMQILSAVAKMKDVFAEGADPFVDPQRKDGKNGSSRPGQTLRIARKIYHRYREKLLTNNAVDFDDLIFMTRELLTHDPTLRSRLHQRWPHVLVDEYQDTSKAQMDIIKLLSSSTLFVVGDADQSIYSWRGAHVGNLDEVATEFEAYGKVRTVFLKENYRSTSNIVRLAEKVISSSNAGPTTTTTKDIVVLDDDGNNNEGANTKNTNTEDGLRRSMQSKRGAGPSPRIRSCKDERAEAKFVVNTILGMTTKDELQPGDTVAVLYRTNAQSRYLEEACVQNQVPYVIRGGAGGFYKRAEIKDVLCFVRWLNNGNDEGSMIRAMKTPSKGIGQKAYEEFQQYWNTVQTYYLLNHPAMVPPTPLDILISMSSTSTNNNDTSETDTGSTGGEGDYILPNGAPEASNIISKRALNNLVKFSVKMREIRTKAYSLTIDKLLFFIIDELNLMDHFDNASKSKSEFLERTENVNELRQAAEKYASYGPTLQNNTHDGNDDATNSLDDDPFDKESALSSFLDDVALVSDIAETKNVDEENARLVVSLMTIHAAKGTEFDCVFVVGMEEGTLPCTPALQEGEGSIQLDEEKRLCYVAMTRSKTHLIMTWRKQVTSFSNWSDAGPVTVNKKRSRFLDVMIPKKSQGGDNKKDVFQKRGVTIKRDFSTGNNISSSSSTPFVKSVINPTLPRTSSSNKRSSLDHSNIRKRKKIPRSPTLPSSRQISVDPTWFFPVGEAVVHITLGQGIVLDPPPFENINDAKVRVKFDSGQTLEFSAFGSDIIPL